MQVDVQDAAADMQDILYSAVCWSRQVLTFKDIMDNGHQLDAKLDVGCGSDGKWTCEQLMAVCHKAGCEPSQP